LGSSLAFLLVLFLLLYRVRETVFEHHKISIGAIALGFCIWFLGVTLPRENYADFSASFLGTIGGLTVVLLIFMFVRSFDKEAEADDLRTELALHEKIRGLIATFILKAQRDGPPGSDIFEFAKKLVEDARNAGLVSDEEYAELVFFFNTLAAPIT
jgi:hypothetical protein